MTKQREPMDPNQVANDLLFQDQQWMTKALALAEKAAASGEVPVGAIIVDECNQVIGEGWNQPISSNDPTAHAEIIAVRQAAAHCGNYRLPNTTLYVTLEPCTMCAGAIIHSRIGRLVFAAAEPKAGAVVSQSQVLNQGHNNHSVEFTGGVCAEQASTMISQFFAARRADKK